MAPPLLRKAIITDEVDQDPVVAMDLARLLGFAGVEIRSAWDTEPLALSEAQCTTIRDEAARRSLEIVCFDSPAFKCDHPADSAAVATCRDDLVASVERANWLGAPLLRVFSFYRRREPDPIGAAAIIAPALVAEADARTTFVLETGMRTNTPDAITTLQFMEAANAPEVGVLWDPGNTVFSGVNDHPFPTDYELLRPFLRHVHVKDPIGQDRYTRLGDGDVPWPAILAALRADAFDGYVSLETHWRHDRVLDQLERDRPWGSSFSAQGRLASAICMATLATFEAP